ncbi:MAG: hypothetical protein GX675_04905 [Erysipelotrichaceae bacterium]|nr:hypothetical protein [Erysipelotrichaceae bacterium]
MRLFEAKTKKVKINDEEYEITLLSQGYDIGVKDKEGVVHYLRQETEVEEVEDD